MRASCLLASLLAVAFATNANAQDLVARGQYLAKAADCMPCHTASKDKPYAGGLKLNTPFGALYSPNITPDEDDRHRQVDGRSIQEDPSRRHPGRRQISLSGDAVRRLHQDQRRRHQGALGLFQDREADQAGADRERAGFPFNIRYGMLVWRWLYFDEAYFKPDPARAPVEPRRLSRRGARPLRRLPHAAQLHGRNDRQQAAAGRQDRPMVCAGHQPEDAGDGQ